MDINLMWVALFIFLLCVGGLVIASPITGKPYWRFGVGFAFGISLQVFRLAFIAPILATWPFPLLLFIGVPIVIMGMLIIFCLATYLGVLLYGKRR